MWHKYFIKISIMALFLNHVSLSLITCTQVSVTAQPLLCSVLFCCFLSSFFLSALFSTTVLSPWSGLVLLIWRWCGLEGWSWCEVTCLPITVVELRLALTSPALGCFCSPQLMRIICRDAVEGCHKDLAQGVWENSRSVFHAQTLL